MKPFEYFVEEGEVKSSSKNIALAQSLIRDMNERINELQYIDEKKMPKLVFEHYYDALRSFCDALLAKDGYKSYSHQASISYLSTYGYDISIISALDNFRYKRNGSKYYGEKISYEDAKEIKDFYDKIRLKIKENTKDLT
ncbi:hypothetical protein COU57_02240 [Candidatus Pacearchaeota archaeon CG10_big_fil_rev_8_21_14_0_10_32_14]|nr:MAG: hypothetical protein COU57_02240 [Candidatus Pacearchaeota archaeon CG10_big_fil_rev_8_21_14_0_10_32_14]